MSRIGFFACASLESLISSVDNHTIKVTKSKDAAAMDYLREHARQLGLSVSDGLPRGVNFRRQLAQPGSILYKRAFFLVRVVLEQSMFQKMCLSGAAKLDTECFRIKIFDLVEYSDMFYSWHSFSISSQDTAHPDEYRHIFWSFAPDDGPPALQLIAKNATRKPKDGEADRKVLMSEMSVTALLVWISSWGAKQEFFLEKFALTDATFMHLEHIGFRDSPLAEYWLAQSDHDLQGQPVGVRVLLQGEAEKPMAKLHMEKKKEMLLERKTSLQAAVLEQKQFCDLLSFELRDVESKIKEINDEKVSDEKINDEKVSDEKINDEKINAEKISHEKISDEKIDDEKPEKKKTRLS